jgi:hypothetical protein
MTKSQLHCDYNMSVIQLPFLFTTANLKIYDYRTTNP